VAKKNLDLMKMIFKVLSMMFIFLVLPMGHPLLGESITVKKKAYVLFLSWGVIKPSKIMGLLYGK